VSGENRGVPGRTSRTERDPFVVECPTCGVEKGVEAANEGLDFYRRHRKLTGHDVEWRRTTLDFDDPLPTDEDLKTVMWALDERFEEGVPVGVVAAVRSEQGRSMERTLAEIEDLRMSGELYEPRDDHLSPF
jgi:hypothetical protein